MWQDGQKCKHESLTKWKQKNPFQSFIQKKNSHLFTICLIVSREWYVCWKLLGRQQAHNLFDQCQFKLKILAFISVKIPVEYSSQSACVCNNKYFSRQAFLINQVNYTIWPLDAVHLSVHDFCCLSWLFGRFISLELAGLLMLVLCVDSSQFSVKRVDRVVCWKLQQCINEFFLFSFAELHGTMFIFGFFYTSLFMQWMMVVVNIYNVCVWVCLSLEYVCTCDVWLCCGVAFFLRSFFFKSTTAVKTWLFL